MELWSAKFIPAERHGFTKEINMLRKTLLGGVASFLVLFAGGTANAYVLVYGDEMERARDLEPTGTDFESYLTREYRDFFLFEADKMYDWIDADYFAAKALMADEGRTVEPEDPANWNISEPHMSELVAARRDLTDALDRGGRESAPEAAAVAQGKYDCWVEQQEEGHQPDHIAACRDDFMAAMAELEEAMQVAEPEPETRVVVGEELARTILYFDFDRSNITPAAQTTIDNFVEEMKGKGLQNVGIFLEGHADRAGPPTYNEQLSERRAEEVRRALLQEGIEVLDLDEMKTAWQGENRPAVPTPDGVPAQANRRVEIVARGMYAEEVPAESAPAQSAPAQ
jgi:OmpA-OmpF porin, OOP family